MAASSSMMRMRGVPTIWAVRCRWRDSAAISVASDMYRLPLRFLMIVRQDWAGTWRPTAGSGELKLEGSSYAGLTFYMNLAGVLLNNPIADGEAEACALVLAFLRFGLGREEGIVD